MSSFDPRCPNCGHFDLDPRGILVGIMGATSGGNPAYREIVTLKCQWCGWLGEAEPTRLQA